MRTHEVGPESKINMSVKTFLAVLGALAVGVTAWVLLKSEVSSHTKQLEAISLTVGADHDQLKVQGAILDQQSRLLEKMDRKLDYVTGASRTRPAASSNPGSP